MIIPEPINTVQAKIDAWHESQQEPPRPHMGASMLGHPCDRWLWLSFRWVVQEKFSGRMLRLFRRGHNEEESIVRDLRNADIDVTNTGANQSRVTFGSHVSGSVDGIVSNLPFSPKKKAILECKTHSDKSFKELVDKGVQKSKPMHFIQCQVYMLGMKLDRALYYAINKNTDEIYTEWLKFDQAVADKYIARGKAIALSDRMPPPLSTDPSWYQCKFCAAHSFCHKTQLTKEVNCRTCANSTAREDGIWSCEEYSYNLAFNEQLKGCEEHVLHPDLVPWPYTITDKKVTWITPEGNIKNGAKSADVFSSREIVTNHKVCASPDAFIKDLRKDFGAEIF